jgi:hypothetical protein
MFDSTHPLAGNVADHQKAVKAQHVLSRPNEHPANHINAGFVSALREMWRMVEISPLAYAKTFGDVPTFKQYESMLRSASPILNALATSHIQIFINYRSQADESQEACFYVKGTPDDPRLHLKTNVILETTQGNWTNVPKTFRGCPALRARAQNGRGMIDGMYNDWVLPVAMKYVYPEYLRRKRKNLD